jgi:hypothetical protein
MSAKRREAERERREAIREVKSQIKHSLGLANRWIDDATARGIEQMAMAYVAMREVDHS